MHESRRLSPAAAHRPRGRRRTTAVVAAILATVAVGAIAAPAASAHGPGQNGCTLVPDSGRYFDFHAACDRHDLCYDQLWFGKGRWIIGTGWTGRLACDDLWRREMSASCDRRYPRSGDTRRRRCGQVIGEYYAGVRLFGGPWFDNPNLN